MADGFTAHQRRCGRCGTLLDEDQRFCENCGAAADQSSAWRSAGSSADSLLAEATANETYRGNRLLYTDQTTAFDPLVNASYQRGLIAQFLATVAAWWLGSFLLFLIFGIYVLIKTVIGALEAAGSIFDPYSPDSPGGGAPIATIVWVLLQVILSVVLAIFFWIRRIPVQLTEWMTSLDGRADSARMTLDHMYAVITARRTPIQSLRVVRFRRTHETPRDYLRIHDDIFTGFVTSFGYGSDLFLGWTFWLNMSPARWLIRCLARLFKGQGLGIYGSIMYDRPKAMRELIHSTVRQGIDVANGTAEPRGQGLIGSTVPVKDVVV